MFDGGFKYGGNNEDVGWLNILQPYVERKQLSENQLFSYLSKFNKLKDLLHQQRETKRLILENIEVQRNHYRRVKNKMSDVTVGSKSIMALEELHEMYKAAKKKKIFMERDLAKYEQQLEALKTLLEKKKKEFLQISSREEIKSKLETLEFSILCEKEKNMKLKNDYKFIVEENKRIHFEIEKMKKEEIEKAKQLELIKGEVLILKSNPRKCEFRNSSLKEQVENRTNTISLKEAKIEELENDIDRKQKKTEKWENDVNDVKKRIDDYRVLIRGKQRSNNDKDIQIKSFTREKFMLMKKISNLEKQYLGINLEYEKTNGYIKAMKVQQRETRKKNQREKVLQNTLLDDISIMKECKVEICEKIQDIVNGLKESKGNLRKINNDIFLKIASFLSEVKNDTEIEKKVKKQKKILKMLDDRIKSGEEFYKENTKRFEKLSHERSKIFSSIQDNKRKFVKMCGDAKKVEFEIKELKKRCQNQKFNTKKIERRIQYLKEQIRKYHYSFRGYENTVLTTKKEIELLKGEHNILHRKSFLMEKNVISLMQKVQVMFNRNEKMRTKQNSQEKIIEEIRDLIENQESVIKMKVCEIDGLENSMKETKNEMELISNIKIKDNDLLMDKTMEVYYGDIRFDSLFSKLKVGSKSINELEVTKKQLGVLIKELKNDITVQLKREHKLKGMIANRSVLREENERLEKKLVNLQEEEERVSGTQDRYKLCKVKEIKPKFEVIEKCEALEKDLQQLDDQIMEKNVLLLELTKNSDLLRKKSIKNRVSLFDDASSKVKNDYLHQDIKKQNEKMKSKMSELAIYRSQLYSLKNKNDNLEKLLLSINERLSGVEEIKNEGQLQAAEFIKVILEKQEKEKKRIESSVKYDMEIQAKLEKDKPFKRPNAYIPVSGLIPIPYHSWASPILSTSTGASMRHIKRPKSRDVQL